MPSQLLPLVREEKAAPVGRVAAGRAHRSRPPPSRGLATPHGPARRRRKIPLRHL